MISISSPDFDCDFQPFLHYQRLPAGALIAMPQMSTTGHLNLIACLTTAKHQPSSPPKYVNDTGLPRATSAPVRIPSNGIPTFNSGSVYATIRATIYNITLSVLQALNDQYRVCYPFIHHCTTHTAPSTTTYREYTPTHSKC